MKLQVPMALDADSPEPNARQPPETSNTSPREAGRTSQSYGVRIAPVTVLVDRSGNIRGTGVKIEEIRQALDTLLAEQSS